MANAIPRWIKPSLPTTGVVPLLRKISLTTHMTSSVGWFGATAGFLALAVTGVTSSDVQVVRAAYVAAEVVAWFVVVPLSLTSLLTGLIHSLGTPWGLVRHYWILAKLGLNVLATTVLLLHTQLISDMADEATTATTRRLFGAELEEMRNQLVNIGIGGLVVLLVAIVLAVFKPRGMTPYGRRKQQQRKQHQQRTVLPRR